MPSFRNVTQTALVLSLSAAILTLASLTTGAQARQSFIPEKLRGAFPGMDLGNRQSRGQDAVNRLGSHLPQVAAWYGQSGDEFRKELLGDKRMRVDQTGRVLFVEDLDQPLAAGAMTSPNQDSIQNGALASLDQTFALHSRPGANRTVFLDFNGASITNTAWNSNGNTLSAQPFDLDGNPGAFSTTELQRIQYIWQRVAEDYAPFDVDITTEQPTPDRLSRSDSTDQVFGTTVVITKSDGIYSCTCGGIAYIGAFNATGTEYYKPALVFYNMLGSGAEKAVAEAISHETGHNMGLHHDGNATDTYYGGQGTDPVTGWAPIMGVGYYKPLVQFSKGEYSGANNTEDDFAVAQSFGLPLRSDDYGNTAATAQPLQPSVSGNSANASIDGVIETAGDRDVFAIASAAGTVSLSVAPASRSADADLVLTLSDVSGRVLATANPANALGASLSVAVPAQGTYFVEVRSTGQGDPASTGYSSYGSVGNFRLTAAYPAAAGASPTAIIAANVTTGTGPLAVTFDGTRSTDDGRVAYWYWDFGDGSGDQTGNLSSITHVYQVSGTYAARLTVVDDTGLSATSTVMIAVSSAIPQPGVQIVSITQKQSRKGTSARALVDVTGPNGQVIRGARVQVSWTGIVSRTAFKKSAKNGTAAFVSPVTAAGGCFVLTVTAITATGYSFSNAALPSAQLCV